MRVYIIMHTYATGRNRQCHYVFVFVFCYVIMNNDVEIFQFFANLFYEIFCFSIIIFYGISFFFRNLSRSSDL